MKTITIKIPIDIAKRFEECLYRAEHNTACNSGALKERVPDCKFVNKCRTEPVAFVNKAIKEGLKKINL